MAIYSNKTMLSLINISNNMLCKNIEISRVIKIYCSLLISGISINSLNTKVIEKGLKMQFNDGGFSDNIDTAWYIKLLEYFPQYNFFRNKSVNWVKNNINLDGGYGRNIRDISRIPATGLLLYLVKELRTNETLNWMENIWKSEFGSLTYKAAYTILAFYYSTYNPKDNSIIEKTSEWLASQQEDDGGFAPWKSHPVGSNIYFTSISTFALLMRKDNKYKNIILKAYNYMKANQLKNGIWAYHEIEYGALWGLIVITEIEKKYNLL